VHAIPLRSRAPATLRTCSLEATRENFASASLLGPDTAGTPGGPVAGEVSTSLTTDFREALVDQRHHHGPLAYGSGAALDRPAPDIARGKQSWQARFER
jgi:hypothetical protein